MADYVEGDIVLLSRSKLGIMLSPRTVREIRGEETEMCRIVKKLTAKELAESLVDLMERYNNLETKSLFKANLKLKAQKQHRDITANTNNTKHTKSSTNTNITTTTTTTTTTTSSSDLNLEPKPNRNSNAQILDIPKTPNYGNHAISPTNSMQKNGKFNNHIFYHYHSSKNHHKNTSDIDTPSTKSNDESATTTNSTISSLSPNINININRNINRNEFKAVMEKSSQIKPKMQQNQTENIKCSKIKPKIKSKPKKKLFAKMSKKKSGEAGKVKSKSSRFLFKNKKKISKRSSSNDSPYKHNSNYPHNNNHEYHRDRDHDEYSNHLFVIPRDHSTQTQTRPYNAPKTRFSRSRSNGDTHPYRPPLQALTHSHQQRMLQSPYFITYTPSQHTNNSTITPPIPSPNMLHYDAAYHPQYASHKDAMSPATYSSATPIPGTHNAPPYPAYNKYNLHTHLHAHSSPNPEPHPMQNLGVAESELIDVLLSAPKSHNKAHKAHSTTPKKQKSHPMSYKKRNISYGNNNKLMLEARTCTNLSQSSSDSTEMDTAREIPPSYPQPYVPGTVSSAHNNPLNLLKSPKPAATINPILTYHDHLKNNQNGHEHIKNTSNTHTHTLDSDNYPYIHENSYTNSSVVNVRGNHYKINKQYNDSYIYESYNGTNAISQISPRNSRTHQSQHNSHTHTHQRGASHSPHTSYHRQARKNYHSPRGTNTFGRRPFSANYHQKLNYFDFNVNARSTPHGKFKNNHTKSVTFTEVEGKQYSHNKGKNTNTSKITRIYPKLSQNNAYSTPVYDDYAAHRKRVYQNDNNAKNNKNHWKQAKTVPNNLDTQDLDDNAWFLTSNWRDNYELNAEASQTDTTIVHSHKCKEYHEGRKSHSFSHLGVNTVTSMDDMMTPLTLSPAPHRHGHKKQKRSQSVVDIFDPIQASNLADLHQPDMQNMHRQSSDEAEPIDDLVHTVDGHERDKNYKIVLRNESSDKAYYIQDNFPMANSHKLIKPRFSRSTTSVQTVQSAHTTSSFTPTISHTPSYLKEENLWRQKSIKLSQTASSQTQVTSDDDEEWLLHNHIHINGNNSESVHRFFGNGDVDVEEFPNIESPSNKSSDTVKIINEKIKPVVPPKLSHHDIANEHQLQTQLNRKYRQENMSPTSSKSSLNDY